MPNPNEGPDQPLTPEQRAIFDLMAARCGLCNDTGGVQRTEEGFPVGEPEPCPSCNPQSSVITEPKEPK